MLMESRMRGNARVIDVVARSAAGSGRPHILSTGASCARFRRSASAPAAMRSARAWDDLRPHRAPARRLPLTSGECGHLGPAVPGAHESNEAPVFVGANPR
jgi:hypothetical protein